MYRHAAIACEVRLDRPLTLSEIRRDECRAQATGAPLFPEKRPKLSLLVSMFMHGGIAHLFGNMWFLYLFGNNVEEAFGHLRYLAMYLVAGIVASLVFMRRVGPGRSFALGLSRQSTRPSPTAPAQWEREAFAKLSFELGS